MIDDNTDPTSNWPGQYLSLEQLAKILARADDESQADVFDALLSAVWRGQFNGHIQHKSSTYGAYGRPSQYNDCRELDNNDLLAAFEVFGGLEYGGFTFDKPVLSKTEKLETLARFSYGFYGKFFREAYIDKLFIDLDVARIVNDERIRAIASQTDKSASPTLRRRYDWDSFKAEVLSKLDDEGGLPNPKFDPSFTQARLETEMATWCLKNWHVEPAKSTIRLRVGEAMIEFKSRSK